MRTSSGSALSASPTGAAWTGVLVRIRAGAVLRLDGWVPRPPFLPLLSLFLFLLLLPGAGPLYAQWPGEISGRVLDARTGQPLAAAGVEIEGAGERIVADGTGGFRSRGVDPGSYRVVARHFGYAPASIRIEVRNGEIAWATLELEPLALALDTLIAAARATAEIGASRIARDGIDRLGARTAGDVALALPGVRLVQRTPGGAQTVALRGSGADQVLVLLDGTPLNDPLTGEADLSLVPASSVEELTLLPGARSARYGPRAQGGVILIRTRNASARTEAALSAGSLGEIGARVGIGGDGAGFRWSAGAEARSLRGDFRFLNPAEGSEGESSAAADADAEAAGHRASRRENADLRQLSLRGGAEGTVAGGDWSSRIGFESVDRGNPGRSFAPSRSAREELQRTRASIAWRRDTGAGGATGGASGSDEIALHATRQHTVNRDPDPPFGRPYDDATRLSSSGLRVGLSRDPGIPRVSAVGGGVTLRRQAVRSDLLQDPARDAADVPATIERLDVGIVLRGAVRLLAAARSPELSVAARVHRDGLAAAWHPGHEATLTVPAGGLSLHVAHRSAFSPPTLGDQYFREGVGIAPNPDLRAERIPSEWELGMTGVMSGSRATLTFGGEAYRGDVHDMIVWAPDFRFVWSPRNVDVERSGVEGRAELRLPGEGVRLSGSYSLARVTYGRSGARAGGTSGVQLAYRPRHSASFAAGWEGSAWSGELTGRYTGLRYPVPAAVNAMDPFWSFGASLVHSGSWPGWTMRTVVRADRLLDRRDSHIFGFPEPGRTFSLELRVTRAP